MIWDDHQNKCIGELSFRSEVKGVKLRRDRVIVVLLTKIYCYRFSDLKLLDQINTAPNPRGLVALSPELSSTVLACPGVTRGHVRDRARVALCVARNARALSLDDDARRVGGGGYLMKLT